MKRNIILVSVVASVFFIVLAASNPTKSPVAKIEADYHTALTNWNNELKALKEKVNNNLGNRVEWQQDYLKARLSYKKWAWLIDYLDPEFVKDYVNGAPLPKLERNYSQIQVIEPKGFQPLEEQLWSNDEEFDKSKCIELINELSQQVDFFTRFQKQQRLLDRQLLEATRFALIRFFTLDLTGFDVPASNAQLAEWTVSWAGLENVLYSYTALLGNDEQKLMKEIRKDYLNGKDILSMARNFESFDRLTFLREVINPLYANLLTLHESLGYEKSADLIGLKQAVNYSAKTFFSDDFLNPFFYTQLVADDYSADKVALGKLLFFDPALSASNDRSCASCHQPIKAFTDGQSKSIATGFQGTVKRNAPTLINAVYSPRFFWDMRTNLLETQFEHVVVSSQEFNTSVLELINKLNKSPEYVRLFQDAFPQFIHNPINPYTLNASLACYVMSLRSFNSPFDQYARGETNEISTEIKDGFNLFMGKALCGTCHFAPSFSGIVPPFYTEQESEILGVPEKSAAPWKLDGDIGRKGGMPKDNSVIYEYSFKTVTVRNVALTGPYFHNGAYNTLEEVIDFYHKGGGAGIGLEVPYQTLPFDSLSLTKAEQLAIKKFMEALTDTVNLTSVPTVLPSFPTNLALNKRIIGGVY